MVGVIAASGVHKLLTKIHVSLDSALSTWIGNMAIILAYLFNSSSRQCHEVWASQFPSFHNIKDIVPPTEACLSSHINWSLAQAHKQYSLDLS